MDPALAEFAKYGGLVLALAIACVALWRKSGKWEDISMSMQEKFLTGMNAMTATLNGNVRNGEVMTDTIKAQNDRISSVERTLAELTKSIDSLKGRS